MKKLIAIFLISLVIGVSFIFDGTQFFNNVGKGLPLSAVMAYWSEDELAAILLGAVAAALGGTIMALGGVIAIIRYVKTCIAFFVVSLALGAFAISLGFGGAMFLVISSFVNIILALLSIKGQKGAQS